MDQSSLDCGDRQRERERDAGRAGVKATDDNSGGAAVL